VCAGERENVKERSLNRDKVREIIKEKWSKKWELREQIIKNMYRVRKIERKTKCDRVKDVQIY